MNCPKCRSEVMQVETYENVQIERCPVCKGMYFDMGELEQMILRNVEADTFAFSPMSDAMDELPARCFRCSDDMEAVKGPADLRVDICRKCGGVFLDQGELSTLQLHRA